MRPIYLWPIDIHSRPSCTQHLPEFVKIFRVMIPNISKVSRCPVREQCLPGSLLLVKWLIMLHRTEHWHKPNRSLISSPKLRWRPDRLSFRIAYKVANAVFRKHQSQLITRRQPKLNNSRLRIIVIRENIINCNRYIIQRYIIPPCAHTSRANILSLTRRCLTHTLIQYLKGTYNRRFSSIIWPNEHIKLIQRQGIFL